MRIVLLARSLDPGGMERQLVELARGLERSGHDVHVLLFYGGGRLEQDLREAGVEYEALGKRRRWDVVGFLLRLVRALRRDRPEVIHSFLVVPNVVLALLRPFLSGSRLVWGVRASAMDLSRYDRFARLTFAASRIVARVPDLIVCNSRAGLEDHHRLGYPAQRMIVIPNGIDTDRFRPDRSGAAALRREWGDERVVVGVAARLDPKKGHDVFLEALSLMDRTDVRAVMIGGGPVVRRQELAARARELGVDHRISWLGDRADMARIYNAVDVLCLPSAFGEGFPNVVGEAMACGTPAVVTDVGDAAVVVGDTGVVVPPGDPAALAAGLEELLGRLERSGDLLRAQARERIEDEFGTERLITRTVAAMEALG